jgi:hypothetical protein
LQALGDCTEEQRPVHRHRALHSVGEELLTLGNVADHFERTVWQLAIRQLA